MLIRFRVENFRSLRDEQELSLVASNLTELPEATASVEGFDMDLLRVAAVYGANASGKSSVLGALRFMASVVTESQRSWSPEGGVPGEPFRLDPATAEEPSMFAIDLLLDGIRYEYGFVANSTRVVEEWLYAHPRGRKQEWFTREAERKAEFKFSRLLPGENRLISTLTRPNSLFLSAAAQNNHKALIALYTWFADLLTLVDDSNREEQSRTSAQMFRDTTYQGAMLDLIRMADLGIEEIKLVGDSSVSDVAQRIADDNPNLASLLVSMSNTVVLRHRGPSATADTLFSLDEESRGTQALFALSGAIVKTLKNGGLLCVDELDASLHPLLAAEVVRLFNNPETNPRNAQLIFNTHDTNLLDTSLLRRDQIWFTEKDSSGATHLYPLTDFRARKQENLERGYLQGRYGAVPFIGARNLLGGTAAD